MYDVTEKRSCNLYAEQRVLTREQELLFADLHQYLHLQ